MSRYLRLVIIFFTLVWSTEGLAQVSNASIQSLDDDWLVYDRSSGAFVPFIDEIHKSTNNYYLFIPVDEFFNYDVVLELEVGDAVFIENQLLFKAVNDTVWSSKVRDFEQQVQGKNTILLSLFTSKSLGRTPKAYTLFSKTSEEVFTGIFSREKEPSLSSIEYISKNDEKKYEGLTSYSLIILVLLGAIAKTTGLRGNLYRISIILRGVFTPRAEEVRPTALSVAGTVVAFSLVVSYIMMLTLDNSSWLYQFTWVEGDFESGTFVVKALMLFLVAFMFIIVRGALVLFVGGIYNIPSISSLHTLEYMNFTQLFVIVGGIFSGLWTMNPSMFSKEFFAFLILGIFVLKSFLIYLSVVRRGNARNPYIFSYFCTTEFLPTIIAVKLFINF